MLARGELITHSDDTSEHAADHDAHLHQALAAYGLWLERTHAAEALHEPYYLWPEHVPALQLWSAVQTQWRVGMAGATGLDYAGVRASPAFARLRPPRRAERIFAELCLMERATLDEWAQRRERAS